MKIFLFISAQQFDINKWIPYNLRQIKLEYKIKFKRHCVVLRKANRLSVWQAINLFVWQAELASDTENLLADLSHTLCYEDRDCNGTNTQEVGTITLTLF